MHPSYFVSMFKDNPGYTFHVEVAHPPNGNHSGTWRAQNCVITKTHVTEMTQELLEFYERLLKRQRSPAAATRQFQHWKHDADLLPKLLVQLDAVLAALNKFEPIVYNTQGILDDGTDVAVRYRTSNQGDEERELIGFQVKSYGDLSKPDCMKDLKAQRDDTFRKVRGLSY